MTFNDIEFKACPRCGVEPKVEDVRERSLTKPNVMSVTCPACGMSNSIAWGSMDLPPFRQAVAMLAHGRADAPRVTSAQIGETERRARALERDRARALKRSRKAKR